MVLNCVLADSLFCCFILFLKQRDIQSFSSVTSSQKSISIISCICPTFLSVTICLILLVLIFFLFFNSRQIYPKLLVLVTISRASSLGGSRYFIILLGTSVMSNYIIYCRQMLPRSFIIHFIFKCSMQIRAVMFRQCTIFEVNKSTKAWGVCNIIQWLISSRVAGSVQLFYNLLTAPSRIITQSYARLSRSVNGVWGVRVYSEQQIALASSLYLMQDWTNTTDYCILLGVPSMKCSNCICVKSWQLPSVYFTIQKASLLFILCSSICWIQYFWLVCSTYLLNYDLFFCRLSMLDIPSWKQEGTNLSKQDKCMKSGSILSNIFQLKFSYSIYLYYFKQRSIVGQRDFKGLVPDNLTKRPFMRLVWKVQKLQPTTNNKSGRFILRDLVPVRHKLSSSVLSHLVEEILLVANKLQSQKNNQLGFSFTQRSHWHRLALSKKLRGSIVFQRSLIAYGLPSYCSPCIYMLLFFFREAELLCIRLEQQNYSQHSFKQSHLSIKQWRSIIRISGESNWSITLQESQSLPPQSFMHLLLQEPLSLLLWAPIYLPQEFIFLVLLLSIQLLLQEQSPLLLVLMSPLQLSTSPLPKESLSLLPIQGRKLFPFPLQESLPPTLEVQISPLLYEFIYLPLLGSPPLFAAQESFFSPLQEYHSIPLQAILEFQSQFIDTFSSIKSFIFLTLSPLLNLVEYASQRSQSPHTC